MILSLWANTTVNDARYLASMGMPSVSIVQSEQQAQTARFVAVILGGGAIAAAGGAVAANSAAGSVRAGSAAGRQSPGRLARAGR